MGTGEPAAATEGWVVGVQAVAAAEVGEDGAEAKERGAVGVVAEVAEVEVAAPAVLEASPTVV